MTTQYLKLKDLQERINSSLAKINAKILKNVSWWKVHFMYKCTFQSTNVLSFHKQFFLLAGGKGDESVLTRRSFLNNLAKKHWFWGANTLTVFLFKSWNKHGKSM